MRVPLEPPGPLGAPGPPGPRAPPGLLGALPKPPVLEGPVENPALLGLRVEDALDVCMPGGL
jgi:hypothetical protein